ncbi:MAG TPA: cyclic nucleotide-binding domain-containing protein [Polyangia bacterium]|jgi:cAMP-binding proteins - catabolite gene activator and regulatory subunit of cAMP-dependent protein kinases|nr:cyclic nucleotide-binding domain-containing protein [Polyangia bacterium]
MADLRKLKDEALSAAANANWKKAASLYATLEQHERDGLWPLKLGECLRKLGHKVEALKALSRAVDIYAKADLLLKAIAVCKLILEIDPNHTKTQQVLAAFSASRSGTQPGAAAPAPVPKSDQNSATVAWAPASHVRGSAAAARRPLRPSAGATEAPTPRLSPLLAESPSGEPPPALLQEINLAAMLPGARQSDVIPVVGDGAALEIPIDFGESASLRRESKKPAGPAKPRGPRTMARAILPKTPFFSVLSEAQLCSAIERVQLIQLEAGEILFDMGDVGDVLYVVASGEIAVLVPQEVARLQEGDIFGEIALLAHQPRTATTRATVSSQVLALDRPLVRDLISGSPELLKVLLRLLRERLIATLAHTSPLLAPFSDMERVALTAKFRFLDVDGNVRLVEQGKKTTGLFVLLAGEAAAVSDGAPVAHFQAGDVFGEMSLIAGSPATATVVTLERSFVLQLPRSDFNEVIMTHPQVLEYLGSLADNRMQAIGKLKLL